MTMSLRLNSVWIDKQREAITAARANNSIYEIIESFPKAKTFLITELSTRNIPFVVYSLGSGVVRITTDTTTCPCCKRKL
jgi:hypothetical protein